MEDREGNIWCQSFRGNFYYTNGDSLVLEPLISGKGSFIAAQMLNGQVLATVIKNGVNLFDVKSKRLKSIDIPNLDIVASTLNYKDTYILNSPSNAKQYEVKANGSIVVNYKKTNTRFYHSAFFNNQLNSISKEYPFIVSGLQGFTKEIIIKTNKEIYINNIRAISNNRLAICTTGGLYLLDENYKIINRVGFYTDVNISNICEDSEGNFWLSTIDNGILVTNQFGIIISHNDYIFETISNYKNILYLGTLDNSIFRLNLETRLLDTIYFTSPKHKISNFLYNPKKDELVFSNFTFNVLKKNKEIISIPLHVNSIDTIDSEHYLIAHREGLCIYPNDNSELINKWKAKAIYSKDKSVLTIASGQAFFTTKCIDGKVYTSTNNELLEFSENGIEEINLSK